MPNPNLSPGQGQDALFGDFSVPTAEELKAAELQADAELDIKIPQIAKAGDRRNKPDYDPNSLTESPHQEISDVATVELEQHGPEPTCPAWALPDNMPKVGLFLPDFGPVTESRLAEAQRFAGNRYDKYLRDYYDWEKRAHPEAHAHRSKMAQAAREVIPAKPTEIKTEIINVAPAQSSGRGSEARARIGWSPDEEDSVLIRSNIDLEQQADAIYNLMQTPKPRNLDEPPLPDELIVEGDWPTPPDPSRQIRLRRDQFIQPKPDPYESSGSLDEVRAAITPRPADVPPQRAVQDQPSAPRPMNVDASIFQAHHKAETARQNISRAEHERRYGKRST